MVINGNAYANGNAYYYALQLLINGITIIIKHGITIIIKHYHL